MKRTIFYEQLMIFITLVLLMGLLCACSQMDNRRGEQTDSAATSSLQVEEEMEIDMDEDESYTIR